MALALKKLHEITRDGTIHRNWDKTSIPRLHNDIKYLCYYFFINAPHKLKIKLRSQFKLTFLSVFWRYLCLISGLFHTEFKEYFRSIHQL